MFVNGPRFLASFRMVEIFPRHFPKNGSRLVPEPCFLLHSRSRSYSFLLLLSLSLYLTRSHSLFRSHALSLPSFSLLFSFSFSLSLPLFLSSSPSFFRPSTPPPLFPSLSDSLYLSFSLSLASFSFPFSASLFGSGCCLSDGDAKRRAPLSGIELSLSDATSSRAGDSIFAGHYPRIVEDTGSYILPIPATPLLQRPGGPVALWVN